MHFTLCFFDDRYRNALDYCSAHSGRDVDKTGLTPVGDAATTWFLEARLVLKCRKLYYQDIQPQGFLEPAIALHYPNEDYHRMYVGEITEVLVKRSA